MKIKIIQESKVIGELCGGIEEDIENELIQETEDKDKEKSKEKE